MSMTLNNDNKRNESKERKEEENEKKLHIVFLHLDLGIGGAEQLMINLALASTSQIQQSSTSLNAKVSIFTTHCSQSHCFDAVRQHPTHPGPLAHTVHLVGTFLPPNVFGYGTALCSTVRMLYLSYWAKRTYPDADVFVLDVLSTPMPYLLWGKDGGVSSVLFYCHFPDKLLTRDTVNGVPISVHSDTDSTSKSLVRRLKDRYRMALDSLEEWTMSFADLICVNSQFTKREVLTAFPSLLHSHAHQDSSYMQVLYPAIDLTKFIPPNFTHKEQQLQLQLQPHSTNINNNNNNNNNINNNTPIVSLNRFERKKNIQLLIRAYATLLTHPSLPPLIIAGGYDPRNTENVQYLTELQTLTQQLHIPPSHVQFRPSISDEERATLLQSALCVAYTPHREHFGIVPLEAMYAGTPVVAIHSGGPVETVVSGYTGILVKWDPCQDHHKDSEDHDTEDDDLVKNFGTALKTFIDDPSLAVRMGRNGHIHVKTKFGLDTFRQDWKRIVNETRVRGKARKRRLASNGGLSIFISFSPWFTFGWNALLVLGLAVGVAFLLRREF